VIELGANPRAVRVAPDGETFYVYEALDFRVSAFNADSLRKTDEVTVCESPMTEEILLGKRLFYTARSPMSARRWISCSSCHPDGDADGQTWQQPEGLRQTQPLFGLGWTHPLHWSADRDEVQDFEHTIRGLLMQGRGLARGDISESLEDFNSGLSDELDALAAYTNSHQFSLSPHAKGGLSDSAQRGRELFLSSSTGCADCHGGPCYSDSRPDWGRMHDVGTGANDASELMGTEYDTPTLLGVYRSAPYLHTGEAVTLEDVLTTMNPNDRHGRTSQLSENEVADLAEFLRSLPYEDPVPAAEAENWPLITSGPPPRGDGAE
jgi:cytochrome c peroxidase